MTTHLLLKVKSTRVYHRHRMFCHAKWLRLFFKYTSRRPISVVILKATHKYRDSGLTASNSMYPRKGMKRRRGHEKWHLSREYPERVFRGSGKRNGRTQSLFRESRHGNGHEKGCDMHWITRRGHCHAKRSGEEERQEDYHHHHRRESSHETEKMEQNEWSPFLVVFSVVCYP